MNLTVFVDRSACEVLEHDQWTAVFDVCTHTHRAYIWKLKFSRKHSLLVLLVKVHTKRKRLAPIIHVEEAHDAMITPTRLRCCDG